MELSNWIDAKFGRKESWGLNLKLQRNGKPNFDVCQLKWKAKDSIVDLQESAVGIEELLKLIPRGSNLSMNICGDGTVLREFVHELDQDQAYAEARAGIDESYFYASACSSPTGTRIHMLRRAMVDPIIQEIEKAGIDIVLICVEVQALVDSEIARSEECLQHPQSSDWTAHFMARSFEENRAWRNFGDEVFKAKWDLFQNKERAIKSAKISISIWIVLILTSLGIHLSLRSAVGGTMAEKHALSSIEQKIELLQSKLQKRRDFEQSYSWMQPMQMAFYLDRLAANLPLNMRLSEVTIQEQIANKERRPAFNSKTLNLKTVSNNSTAQSEWMSILEDQEWVDHVALQEMKVEDGSYHAFWKIKVLP